MAAPGFPPAGHDHDQADPAACPVPGEDGSCGNCGGRGWKFLSLRRSEEAAGRWRVRVAAAGTDSVPGVRGYGARIMTAATIIRPRRRAFPGSDNQVAQARLFVGQVLGECPGPTMPSC